MQIDRETLERMSRMNDADFAKAIEAAASQNGISLPSLKEKTRKKVRKSLKKGLTSGMRCDIIIKSPQNGDSA